MIDWSLQPEELAYVSAIVSRARRQLGSDLLATTMDLTACHKSGCPLDLSGLYRATDFDFAHDLIGIHENLNRRTGELKNLFIPRYALSQGPTGG